MADEIDTRVSASFDPGIIGGIEDYDDDTRPLLGQAETLFSEVHQALGAVHDAKAGAATNPTLNEYAQLVQVDTFATKRFEKVWPQWDRVRDTLDNNISRFEQELRAPVEQKAGASMASEIRSYFRGMEKESQRLMAIRAAIREGDEVTVTAVLGGKHYLSGIDAETSALFLQEWHERSQPLKAKQLRAMQAARDMILDREPLLRKQLAEAIGDIKIYQTSKVNGEQILVRTITPREVRAQVKAANKPFAVPV